MQNKKRILSVCIKRMIDDSPDTSWMGEFSNRPKTEYAIDRTHSEDCASVREDIKQAKQTLEHVQQTLGDMQEEYRKANPVREFIQDSGWEALEDAYNEVSELFDSVDACDCGGGNLERDQYRYFNGPVENYEGETPEDIRKYVRQDYDRMESLNAGHWCFIGIRAEATIVTNINKHHGVCHQITSGGLWGIESDSDKDYLESIEKEELAQLRTELKSLGFSSRAISTAFKNIERKED